MINEQDILARMKAFFEDRVESDVLAQLEEVKVTDVLDESIDVVEFIVYLEDELHARLNANRIGPAAATMTFREVAAEICREINAPEDVLRTSVTDEEESATQRH